ncbi:MAG: hypothetical protein RR877_00585 [Aurantimicrobium sp.]|uniref:hypothetical protein n=1 Tax=Aurantimicrobium sp. TaxID=1930784 RepID=UPI002FC71C27
MKALSSLEKEVNLIEIDLLAFLSYFNKDPNTFKGITDLFYKDKALKEKRFSRFGEAIALNVQSIILHMERMKLILDKQKHSGCCHTSELRRLINLRKGFLDRKCDEFLIAVYDFRIEDMEIDKTQLRFSIADTLERLKNETRKYSLSLE